MSKPKTKPPGNARTAFSVYQKLMRRHGTSVVLKELYQWFMQDRQGIGNEYSGLFNLLSKPEKEAIKVLDHIHARITGGTEKARMSWEEFMKQQPKKK
jgi:hypothetical protein